jgi:hypothetical protein
LSALAFALGLVAGLVAAGALVGWAIFEIAAHTEAW